MLPHAEYPPAFRTKSAIHSMIPISVPLYLTTPKRPIGSGDPATVLATVPEATINEYGQLRPWKDEIGLARETGAGTEPPASNSTSNQHSPKPTLRRLCAMRSVAPHHSRTLGLCEYVCHRTFDLYAAIYRNLTTARHDLGVKHMFQGPQ